MKMAITYGHLISKNDEFFDQDSKQAGLQAFMSSSSLFIIIHKRLAIFAFVSFLSSLHTFEHLSKHLLNAIGNRRIWIWIRL